MRRRYAFRLGILVALVTTAGAFLFIPGAGETPGDDCPLIQRTPTLRPDYRDLTLPPNLAPLNFAIEEEGSHFFVRISSPQAPPLELDSTTGTILIPQDPWKRLLQANRGGEVHLNVFVKDREGRWNRYETVSHHVAQEDIDSHVVYRNMHPISGPWTMSLRSRDLASFRESPLLSYKPGHESACMNCHTPLANNPATMLIGVRSARLGRSTLLVQDGRVKKIDRKFGYSSWHPGGHLAVFSVNNLPIFFHSAGKELRDTTDRDSYLAFFRVDTQEVRPCPQLSKMHRLENWPVWAPDGRHLYFCSAPKLWTNEVDNPPQGYQEVRYDLERIPYDAETGQWGRVETVLSADTTGQSIAMPRISPDGRWLSFCMFDHGFFPNWREESDLYLIDLDAAKQNGKPEYRRMELNSNQSESWHSWSSNSRWIIFSSKRGHGIFTRLYLSHIDDTGRAHKPFILPQEDPAFYDSCLDAFNTPELITGPVPFREADLLKAIHSTEGIAVDAVSMPTSKGGEAVGRE